MWPSSCSHGEHSDPMGHTCRSVGASPRRDSWPCSPGHASFALPRVITERAAALCRVPWSGHGPDVVPGRLRCSLGSISVLPAGPHGLRPLSKWPRGGPSLLPREQ